MHLYLFRSNLSFATTLYIMSVEIELLMHKKLIENSTISVIDLSIFSCLFHFDILRNFISLSE